MNIKRIKDIIRCKRNKHSVTLRYAYKGLTFREEYQDLALRIKLHFRHIKKLHSLFALTKSANAIQALRPAWYLLTINLIDKTAQSDADSSLLAIVEPEAIPYVNFL